MSHLRYYSDHVVTRGLVPQTDPLAERVSSQPHSARAKLAATGATYRRWETSLYWNARPAGSGVLIVSKNRNEAT